MPRSARRFTMSWNGSAKLRKKSVLPSASTSKIVADGSIASVTWLQL